MMPRHTIGNPRYENADIRRPVSSHRIHQTAPLCGARYDSVLKIAAVERTLGVCVERRDAVKQERAAMYTRTQNDQ